MFGCDLPVMAITDHHLCPHGLVPRLQEILPLHPAALLLREKDLDEAAYQALAQEVLPLCQENAVPLILHGRPALARRLGVFAIHLPMPQLLSATKEDLAGFSWISTSIHRPEEAALAAQHGATALLAGHIFPTQCKAGLQPRGLSFLQEVLAVSPLPVWAIGGIHQATLPLLVTTGCAGACMMSEWMNGHPIP